MILLEDWDTAEGSDTIRYNMHDMPLCILIFIFMDVKFEVQKPDKGVCHLAHLLLSAIERHAEEYGLFLISIEVEFGSQCNSSMEYPFGILLVDFCGILTQQYSNCFQKSLDVDEG